MTKTEIITEMESKGAVNVKALDFGGNLDYNENEIHPIKYRRELGSNQHSEPETLYLIKQPDDTFTFENGKPAWMREVPELRPFHVSDADIKAGLEAANAGWEVLQIRKSRDGVLDIVNVDYAEGEFKLDKSFSVWKREDGTVDYKEIV